MSPYLVWFLLFSLFLFVAPSGISPFEASKVILAEIVIDFLLIIRFFSFGKSHFRHLLSGQTMLLAILVFLSIVQFFLFDTGDRLFGNPFRLQGVLLLWHLILFSIISKEILISHLPKAFYYLSFILLILAAIILGVNRAGRAFGTLGEPNALAATALFIFPFVFFQSIKPVKILAVLATILVILLSGSRAGLVGFGIEMSFILLIGCKFAVSKSTLVSLLLLLSVLTLPFTESAGRFENRSQIWKTALYAGMKSPIIGQGFGNIQNPIHQSALKLNNPVQYLVVDSAHNFILDWWIQAGIVGVISIISLIFLALQGFIRHKKILELTAFLGLTAAMLFNPVSVVNLLSFWWLIGQGISDH